MELNDRNAKLLLKEERYPNGANFPTTHLEYKCPCGKGKIIDERIYGFGEYYSWIQCKKCSKIYELEHGKGYIWEVVEK